MPEKRPSEPIAPATIPGQPLDPKIPPANDDEDDEVGTDEDGKEMLRVRKARTNRVPATDAEPEGSIDKVNAAPLGITSSRK
jgi:hypothetical protein